MTESFGMQSDPAAPEQAQGISWRGTAVQLVGQIARLAEGQRGEIAALRRMDPDKHDAPVFWRLLAGHNLLGSPTLEDKWALILHGIALMTPTSSGHGVARKAHDGTMPVGKSLFLGGETQRNAAFYSEARLNRLLTARGAMLRVLLSRMFRMLANAGVPFDWREMATFILNDGYDEVAAERARHRIARSYYQAERRNTAFQESESD